MPRDKIIFQVYMDSLQLRLNSTSLGWAGAGLGSGCAGPDWSGAEQDIAGLGWS